MTPLLLLACLPDGVGPAGTGAGVEDSGVSTALPGDSADDDTGEDPGYEDPWGCADLYDPSYLPAYELEIGSAEWARLRADFTAGRKDYHEVTLTLDGERVPAQIRLKGNPDFSWFGDKLQFVISFNEVDPDARFHGLRKTT
jgi:hypothetical protein